MIDNGASHCFISEKVAHQLNLPMDTSCRFSVALGNGQQVSAKGLCRQVPLYLHSHTFVVDCFVFPLGGVDLILGVSWVACYLGQYASKLAADVPWNSSLTQHLYASLVIRHLNDVQCL